MFVNMVPCWSKTYAKMMFFFYSCEGIVFNFVVFNVTSRSFSTLILKLPVTPKTAYQWEKRIHSWALVEYIFVAYDLVVLSVIWEPSVY